MGRQLAEPGSRGGLMHIRSLRPWHIGLVTPAALVIGLVAAPSASAAPEASAQVSGDTLYINGTQGPDAFQIGLGADPNTLLVDTGNGAAPLAFDRSTFSAISVDLKSGDDTFSVATTRGDISADQLTVHGGFGNDTIAGGQGSDVLFGAAGDDTITGGDGDDLIFGQAGNDTVDGQRGTDTEILASGEDVAVWLPGEGSDIINGGRGQDALNFVGANIDETFALNASDQHAILTRNVGTIRMDMLYVEQVNLTTLGGVDSVTVGDLRGTDGEQANVDLAGQNGDDSAVDTVVVDGTDSADHVNVTAD